KPPQELAAALAHKIKSPEFEKVESSGGYVNFFLSREYIQNSLAEISGQEHYGRNDNLKDKTVMVEYTDLNPFKPFHIGHLMPNVIGEAIARLHNASGAKVVRVNYQSDVGMHIANAIWAIENNMAGEKPSESISLTEKAQYLGTAY